MTIDELPSIPDLAMSPERIEAMRAALVREISAPGHGPAPARAGRPPLPSGLLSRPRLRVASGLALGVLAATLALNYGPSAARGPAAPTADGQAVLAASWADVPEPISPSDLSGVMAFCIGPNASKSYHAVIAQRQGNVYMAVVTASTLQKSTVVCLGTFPTGVYGGASVKVEQTGGRILTGGAQDSVEPVFSTYEVDQLEVQTPTGPAPGTEDAPGVVIGRVSPTVAEVELQTADPFGGTGRTVQAMLGGGLFVAWWPQGYAKPTKIIALAADGSVLQTAQVGK